MRFQNQEPKNKICIQLETVLKRMNSSSGSGAASSTKAKAKRANDRRRNRLTAKKAELARTKNMNSDLEKRVLTLQAQNEKLRALNNSAKN